MSVLDKQKRSKKTAHRGKVGLAGIKPATKRIQYQIQLGYEFYA